MNNFRYKPVYLDFPIFQIAYVMLWIPVGFIVSYILSAIVLYVVTEVMNFVLGLLLPMAFEFFLISGRMNAMEEGMIMPVAIAFDFFILIIGLELISYFLNKKRLKGGFDEQSDTSKN